jgi:Co/Zn/Cd efflux system component
LTIVVLVAMLPQLAVELTAARTSSVRPAVGLLAVAIDMERVRSHILESPGVIDCHDLHAWTITSGMNVLSAHVTIRPDAERAGVLDALCGCLSADFDIEHSTFQLETTDRRRLEERSHV